MLADELAEVVWEVKRCKSCSTPITFVMTGNGKPMPILADIEPPEPIEFEDNGCAGRVQIAHVAHDLFGGDSSITVNVLAKGDDRDTTVPIWLSHFVDCPQSEDWRKSQ